MVPDKVSDNSLITMAHQFQHNRFPVVTWKHPKKHAVLLRSSSFVPSSIAKKTVSTSALGYVQSSIHPGTSKDKGNVGGVGVSNIDVENYLLSVLLINQVERNQTEDTDGSNLVMQVSIPPRAIEFDPELQRTSSVSSTGSNQATPRSEHKLVSKQPSSVSVASAGSIDSGLGGDTVQQPPLKAAINGGSPEANRKGKGTASKFLRKLSRKAGSHGVVSHKNSKASKGTLERKQKTPSESTEGSDSPDAARKRIESEGDSSKRALKETSEGRSSPVVNNKAIESDVSDTPTGSPDLNFNRKADRSPSSSPQLTRAKLVEVSESTSEDPEQDQKLTTRNDIGSRLHSADGKTASPLASSRWSRKAVKKSPKLSRKFRKIESPPLPSFISNSPILERKERLKSPVADSVGDISSGDSIQLTDIVMEEKRATSVSPSGQEPVIDWEAVGEDSRTSTPAQAEEGQFRTSTPEGTSSPELPDRRFDGLEVNWEHFEGSHEIQARREWLGLHSDLSFMWGGYFFFRISLCSLVSIV